MGKVESDSRWYIVHRSKQNQAKFFFDIFFRLFRCGGILRHSVAVARPTIPRLHCSGLSSGSKLEKRISRAIYVVYAATRQTERGNEIQKKESIVKNGRTKHFDHPGLWVQGRREGRRSLRPAD